MKSARSWLPATTSRWDIWNDAEETARFFRNGRLFTGDMARVDRDGFIFIVERARDFIKAMGNRVSPKEIEEVLSQMPEVVEAAVIGVPDEIWGEAIKAYLTTNKPGQLTVEDVRNHCLGQLPNYKVPEYVEFLSPIAQNGQRQSGKRSVAEDVCESPLARPTFGRCPERVRVRAFVGKKSPCHPQALTPCPSPKGRWEKFANRFLFHHELLNV